jgi:tetratricopeptide (TPR) repeat protein
MKWVSFVLAIMLSAKLFAQDPASLMEEGKKLEQKFKEEEAIEKYKQAAFIQPTNQKAIIKCAELSCAIGGRKSTVEEKSPFFQQAKKFADAAIKLDSNNADANYIMSVVYGKLTEVEKKNEDIVNDVKNIRVYIDKAIKLNPQMGKAYHVLGKWHLEVVSLNIIKKAAVKLIYGGVGEATIETAIANMEKCKSMEPYYCLNFFDLARAYQYNQQYEKAISTLEQLAKLPSRQQDDPVIKAQGAALLQKLQ